ncbi:MAG: DUF6311 domain-containing protein, partial [Dokdonella sp.]
RYGAEFSNSIAFVDNVALFALPFKLLRRWLPEPFQYFGLWTLCCFVLQAWFAWLLMGLLTRARFARACGATLFVFAPPFLWRLSGHYQMLGQWLLLASLYVCFGPRRLSRGAAWPVLALTVSLVHTYMTAMVLALWLADMARRLWLEGRTRAELFQLVAVPGLIGLGFWQVGLLMMGKGITKDGFGYYRMNLLTLVDASGWSYLLPDLPEGRGDYEGFNYLGLGGLLLVLAALPSLKTALPTLRSKRQYWPLLGALVGFALFSISNKVGFGTWTFEIPLSEAWVARANALRTGGRMFWPVFYVLLWVLLRALFRRYPPKIAAIAVGLAVLLQVVDTSAGWLPIRKSVQAVGTEWPSPLKSPFWLQVPRTYREIRMVMPQNHPKHYEVFAYFAAIHGMATDSAYFARVDEARLRDARQEARQAVERGRYGEGVLYVLRDRRFEAAARRHMNPETDWLGRVDGYSILAPGWLCRPECRTPGPETSDCSAACPKPER